MSKGKSKGTNFERIICKQLSLWWSGGKSDDIFWRTSGSGARATTRGKKGKKTFGQSSDVQATNPSGQPLIDLLTIEIKKGYSRQTIFDLVDKLPNETKQPYKHFILQITKDCELAKTFSWLLIAKRDYKEALVIMPYIPLYDELKENELKKSGSKIRKANPCFLLKVQLEEFGVVQLFGTTLNQFFKYVKPKHIKDLLKRKMGTNMSEEETKKEAQVYKCLVCDENEVRWDGIKWVCNNCGARSDNP